MGRLPIFREIPLVAGAAGREREMRWVHIIDIPDPLQWVRGHELLLSTGFAWFREETWLSGLVERLHDAEVAGLVLAVGRYFPAVPEPVRAAADRLGFPVFAAPFRIPFIEIIKAVQEQLLREQYESLLRMEEIHRTLTSAALYARSLDELCASVAQLLERSTAILDPEGRILAIADPAEAEQAPSDPGKPTGLRKPTRANVKAGTLPSFCTGVVHERGIEESEVVHHNGQPVIVSPIQVGRERKGYLVVLAGSGPITGLDLRAAEQGATVAALHLMREEAAVHAERRVRSSFVDALLTPRMAGSAGLAEQARLHGFDEGAQHVVGIVSEERLLGTASRVRALTSTQEFTQREHLGGVVYDWLRKHDKPPLLTYFLNLVVFVDVVHGPRMPGQGDSWQDLYLRLASGGARPVLAVGQPHPGLEGVSRSYEEAHAALLTQPLLQGVLRYEDARFLHLLARIPKTELRRWWEDLLQAILEGPHPGTHLEVIRALVEAGFDGQAAARSLFIHPNTLRYRARAIEKLLGRDLSDPETRLLLAAAQQIEAWLGTHEAVSPSEPVNRQQ
ncbi:PucR family transcriptional regulator [Limnochorda pilosa]|uniref:PucR family transcriptional regulator n=1 Tax=Limnochorda pilosa TaxID=1555112 RepID=UPI00130E2AEA|nr:PucR family transcriptional regulator ligand-binding domain-containing protein [Limnochorda pilosa]